MLDPFSGALHVIRQRSLPHVDATPKPKRREAAGFTTLGALQIGRATFEGHAPRASRTLPVVAEEKKGRIRESGCARVCLRQVTE